MNGRNSVIYGVLFCSCMYPVYGKRVGAFGKFMSSRTSTTKKKPKEICYSDLCHLCIIYEMKSNTRSLGEKKSVSYLNYLIIFFNRKR